jgi:hypothetical protein
VTGGQAASGKHDDVRSTLLSALVETLTGFATGAVIWLALLGVRHLFGLDNLDQDFGFAVRRVVRELGARSATIPPEGHEHPAVLLDVDADEDDEAHGPCPALAAAFPNRYSLETPAKSRPGDTAAQAQVVTLNCSSARPLNRYLLAHLIEELDKRGPAAIVLDVVLRREAGVVSPEEDAALEGALAATKTPVVVAMPVDHQHFDAANPFRRDVQVSNERLPVERPPSVAGAVALPEAEQPVRRYPKCYQDLGTGKWVGNLAFVAARLAARAAHGAGQTPGGHDADDDIQTVCRREVDQAASGDGFAPRIAYAIPSLSLRHVTEDAVGLTGRDAVVRVLYQDLYRRCRATDFWAGAACSRRDTYEGRVVVIGTSNPLRRDLHQTPLGTMAGAEVVVNAIRSFELGPSHEHGEHGSSKLGTLVVGGLDLLKSGLLWLVYFVVRALVHRRWRRRPRGLAIALQKGGLAALFFLTLLVTVTMTLWEGYKSLSIVAGVMGMATEQFIEIIASLRKKVESTLHAAFGLGAALLVLALPSIARAEAPRCPDTLLGVRALVTRVDPVGQTFAKQLANGRQETIGVRGVVCVGDSVVLPAGGPVRQVELYVGSSIEVVTPQKPFRNEGGVVASTKRAAQFVLQALGAVGELRAPPFPTATESRGGPAAEGAPVRQVRPLPALKDLPAQRLTADTPPVISWRDGRGPYRCEARDDVGTATVTTSVGRDDAWCAFRAGTKGAVALLVIDARAGRTAWDIQPTGWAEVPRPDWVGADLRAVSGPDRAAWALWLWKNGGPEWRLQALGMLNLLAPTVWTAGYARDSILANLPELAPNERRR